MSCNPCISHHSHISNNPQVTAPTRILDRPLFDLSMHLRRLPSTHRLLLPTTKARRIVTTTSRDLQRLRTGAQEASRSHHKRVPGTSLSAHVSNSTMHGHLTITTAEETSRHATGLRPCLRNKSRRNSTPSKWYVTMFQAQV